jgi:hypothetical protein
MKKTIQTIIPFELKLKLRSLGWKKVAYSYLDHVVHYLNTDFFKSTESDHLLLPNDNLLAKQRIYELTNYSHYRHQELILEITEPTFIEPLMGGVIAKKTAIVEECYALPIGQVVALPYLPLALYKTNHSTIHIERAILLRHPWGDNNYFHFYNDILPKMGILSDLKLFSDLPIIVSKKLYNSSYFQTAIKLANLQDRSWIIQYKEYIKVDKLICIRSHELTKQGIFRNLRLLNFDTSSPRENKKILLLRPPNTQRTLSNRDEVIKMCLNLGFECVDCSKISLEDQINTFANARYIIGEHGAAFANIIYRYGKPLDVIEIFPPEHISTCYFVISQCLGFNHNVYRCHIGSKESYEIETIELEKKLKLILFAN